MMLPKPVLTIREDYHIVLWIQGLDEIKLIPNVNDLVSKMKTCRKDVKRIRECKVLIPLYLLLTV